MYLTDKNIIKKIKEKEISIKPFNKKNLGPNSYDLTLHNEFSFFKYNNKKINLIKNKFNLYLLKPGQKIVIKSNEIIKVSNKYLAILSQRSNYARLFSLNMSFLVDSGYEGYITASLINNNKFPIEIKSGIRFCQIMFSKVDGKVDVPYFLREGSKNLKQKENNILKYKKDSF